MKRTRGSALLYVLVIVVSVSTVVMALASFGTEQFRNQVREERALQVKYAFEGVLAQIRSDLKIGSIEPPETRTIQVGQLTSTVTVTDNGTTLKNTFKVAQTITAFGYTWKSSTVIGASSADPSSVWYWALVSNSNMTFSQPTVSGSVGLGDVFINGNLTVPASNCSVDGDFYTSGNTAPPTLPVTGRVKTRQTKITFPSTSFANYALGADFVSLSSRTVALGSFPSPFYTIAVLGDVSISGTYSGTGVVYASGNVNVTGNVTAANSASHISIIAAGTVTVRSGVTQLDAICYGGQGFVLNNPLSVHGSLIGKDFTMSGSLSIDYDGAILDDPTLGPSLKLPGLWP